MTLQQLEPEDSAQRPLSVKVQLGKKTVWTLTRALALGIILHLP